jgi:hypothetical protein
VSGKSALNQVEIRDKDKVMSAPNLKWWHWLLFGAVFFGIGILVGPMAIQHGSATFTNLIVCILAWTAASVCCVMAFVRLVKLARSMKNLG